MIVDQQLLLTGSYNWTRSAAKYNEENLIVVSDTQTANDFQLVFDSLWERTVSF
jgi:phosphatidylserine/phosphatidylglycerophosphate/cardiolipin synthase-like enzyme